MPQIGAHFNNRSRANALKGVFVCDGFHKYFIYVLKVKYVGGIL